MTNPIATENAQTGSGLWQYTSGNTGQIQAYADATSYNPNDTVTFYISVASGGTTFTLRIFRMGWYGGYGARLVYTSTTQTGVAQGYWDTVGRTLNNAPTVTIDSTTHLVDAHWSSSFTWSVPSNACTGVYVAQLTDANGKQGYVTFVVKGNSTADYLWPLSFTTSCAYNDWAGYSLYSAPTRGYSAGFNRPDIRGYGAGTFFVNPDLNFLRWVEQNGYNISYCSDIDVHVSGASLLEQHKAALSVGHDEYWTLEMRNAWEAARDSGVGLACLGANGCYWSARLEPDSASHANRTLTCYKVGTGQDPVTNDPYYGVDNTRLGTLWRDAAYINRPETLLWGIMYEETVLSSAGFPWKIDASPDTTFLGGTGLSASSSWGADIIWGEYDKVQSPAPTSQDGVHVIASSPLTNGLSQQATSNSTWYRAPSGALVFGAGSIGWCFGLELPRFTPIGYPLVVPQQQKFMANIMAGLIATKSGASTTRGFSHFGFHK